MPNIFRCFYMTISFDFAENECTHVKKFEDEDKNKYNQLLSFCINHKLLKTI